MAEIEQVPAPTADNDVPETEQTDEVDVLNETDPVPEPPEVDSPAVAPTNKADTGLIVNVAWSIGATTSGGFGKSARSPYSIK